MKLRLVAKGRQSPLTAEYEFIGEIFGHGYPPYVVRVAIPKEIVEDRGYLILWHYFVHGCKKLTQKAAQIEASP